MKFTCLSYKTAKELFIAACIYVSWIVTVVIIMETIPPHIAAIVVCFSFIPFVPCVLKWFHWTAPESHSPEANHGSQVVVPLCPSEPQLTDIQVASL